MARRRVEVELLLNAAQYLREARQLALTTSAVAREIDDMGDEADGTSRDLAQMAANTDVAKRQVDDLGDEARGSARDLKLLQEQAKALGLTLALMPQGGGGGQGGGLFGSLGDGKDGDRVHELLGLFKELVGMAGKSGKDAGDTFTSNMSVGINGGSGMMRMALYGSLALLIAGLAPLVGALVGSLFTGAAAIAAMAGGILAASKSAQVQSAASEFGQRISQKFFALGDNFIGPVVKSLDILQQGFDDMDLRNTFAEVAPYVEIVAKGIAGMGREFMPEFRRALIAAGPSLELLARALPQLGLSIGEVFRKIAEAKGARASMLALMGTLIAFVRGVGNVIAWLEDRFLDSVKIIAKVTGMAEDLPFVGHLFAGLNDDAERLINTADTTVFRKLGDDFRYEAGGALDAKNAIDKLNESMFTQYDAQLAASEAAYQYSSDLLAMEQQVKEFTATHRGQYVGTEENRHALQGLVVDLLRVRQANIDAGMSVDEANARYQQQVLDLQQTALQLGFTKDAVAELVGQYARIPPRITTQIVTDYYQQGKPAGEHSGVRFGERALGGSMYVGNSYIVADSNRPEVMTVGQYGNYMYPSVGSWAAAQSGGGGGGGGSVDLTVIVKDTSGRTLRKELITDALNRGQPNNVVSAAYP